jgi:hypothetical protein
MKIMKVYPVILMKVTLVYLVTQLEKINEAADKILSLALHWTRAFNNEWPGKLP